jgi:hypothetical protein
MSSRYQATSQYMHCCETLCIHKLVGAAASRDVEAMAHIRTLKAHAKSHRHVSATHQTRQ